MGTGRPKLFGRGVDRPVESMPLAPGNPLHIMPGTFLRITNGEKGEADRKGVVPMAVLNSIMRTCSVDAKK